MELAIEQVSILWNTFGRRFTDKTVIYKFVNII
jgi:hypothetical protein